MKKISLFSEANFCVAAIKKCKPFAFSMTLLCLFLLFTNHNFAQVWKVGDKVETTQGKNHPATILEIKKGNTYYKVHYDDNAWADGWIEGYWIKARNADIINKALAADGPRTGKYTIYVYNAGFGAYDGYFILKSGGTYEVHLPGGSSAGIGNYSFDKSRMIIIWKSGPFANKAWNGTQKFEVERGGKTDIIRLKQNTIGTNSTDS
jgi:hypothetical protein